MRTMCKQSDHHHLYPNAMSGVLYYEGQLLNNNYPATSKELYLPPRYCSLCVDTTTPYSRAVKLVPLQGSPIPFTLANERRADFENDCSAYCDSLNDADSVSCFLNYMRGNILIPNCWEYVNATSVLIPIKSSIRRSSRETIYK